MERAVSFGLQPFANCSLSQLTNASDILFKDSYGLLLRFFA